MGYNYPKKQERHLFDIDDMSLLELFKFQEQVGAPNHARFEIDIIGYDGPDDHYLVWSREMTDDEKSQYRKQVDKQRKKKREEKLAKQEREKKELEKLAYKYPEFTKGLVEDGKVDYDDED